MNDEKRTNPTYGYRPIVTSPLSSKGKHNMRSTISRNSKRKTSVSAKLPGLKDYKARSSSRTTNFSRSDEDYMWKDHRRKNKHRAQQRYSWLGMLIAVTMGVAVGWMIWDTTVGHKEVQPQGSAEYEALRMQCENVGGLLATATGPYGTDVSCYKDDKKVWWVRL